ncbi:hypothetical protein MUK42_12175 [Musa troglodytarum]|uniref:Uncharacterized protein n=1 Tax=Musa troglodytarum TaxID=320322 RepID=A0A9E7KJQ0_9LILI|nr:hypothetical protein MUK42_12175 [Musa troglodytarum]
MGVSSNSTTKSSSMDFSDLTALSPPPKEGPEPEQRVQQKGADPKPHGHLSWQPEECGQRFGEILNRTCSSSSQRLSAAEVISGSSSTTLQAGIRRAFSMRKSSSARDGYWRIHDTGDGDQLMEQQQQTSNYK